LCNCIRMLKKDELTKLLKSLNDNIQPTPEQVDWVRNMK
jgi:hypothetical protein